MAYIEPAPLKDRENPFEAMMSRFHVASQLLGLQDEIYNVLKKPGPPGNCLTSSYNG